MLKIVEDAGREKFTGVIGPFKVAGEGADISLACPGQATVEEILYTPSLQTLLPRDRVTFTDCSLAGAPQNTGWNMNVARESR
jgi:hypothetical protein